MQTTLDLIETAIKNISNQSLVDASQMIDTLLDIRAAVQLETAGVEILDEIELGLLLED